MLPCGRQSARVREVSIDTCCAADLIFFIVDEEVISTGTGSHKNIARDVAAEEALRILRSRDT